MSQHLALIAHDLKNGLGSLEATLQALAPTSSAAAQAHGQAQDLLRQFVQFLTLYGAEQGHMHALCEDESPSQLIMDVAQQWRERLAQEGRALQVHTALADGLPPFWYFDRRLVRLALDAALHNATRFARTAVWLSASVDDERLCLSVRDDGPGLGHGPTDARHGTGLGTALAQAVAQAHVLRGQPGAALLRNAATGGALFSLVLP